MQRLAFLAPPLCALLAVPAIAQHRVSMGHFVTTDTGVSRGFDISGHAMMVRTSTDTAVYSAVYGLQPSTMYPSHVHDLPCDVNAGGAHYKIDPNVAGTVRANEIWPEFTTNANGEGFGFDSVQHVARPEAQSIVIHDPTDGARLACADLRFDVDGARVARGTFSNLPGGTAIGLTISGWAQMIRAGGMTYATTYVTGLTPSTMHGVHVHALPCGVNEAGGHYKIDPTEPGTVAANEIWPDFTTDSSGVGRGSATVNHLARPEAQSIVVHAPGGTKIACADLVEMPNEPYVASGQAITTATGLDRGFGNLRARARMTRRLGGRTAVVLQASGLRPNTLYGAHVHDRPCSTGGGGHYKLDPTIAGTRPDNELWLNFMTDTQGRGSATVMDPSISRPEAASVVIHDTDGARIACIDLN